MLFVSQEFLFVFLPIALVGFYVVRSVLGSHSSLVWMLGSSLFFYAWNYPPYLVLILASYTINFLLARALYSTGSRPLLALAIIANLSYLGYFKYTNFFLQNLNEAFGLSLVWDPIALPLGISFYTFQQIPYLVDAFRRHFKPNSFIKYAVVNSFYPHLIAGPIIWHREIVPQLDRPSTEPINTRMIYLGITIFTIGLFKKVVLADNLTHLVDPVYVAVQTTGAVNMLEAWIAAFGYSLQLYFDFSGYSEMAIGLALLYGIRFPLNFFSPYQATSLIEFWRRWHMTMTRFFQEFVYVPMQLALGRRLPGAVTQYGAIVMLMFLVGLWHGAGWTWIAWGVGHGLLLAANHGWRALRAKAGVPYRPTETRGFLGRLLGWTLTFVVVTTLWVPFRAPSLQASLDMLASMFPFLIGADVDLRILVMAQFLTEWHILAIGTLICFVALAPNTIQLTGYVVDARTQASFQNPPDRLWSPPLSVFRMQPSLRAAMACGIMAALSLTAILDDSAQSVFIYFNF